jgi:hypothetical protein
VVLQLGVEETGLRGVVVGREGGVLGLEGGVVLDEGGVVGLGSGELGLEGGDGVVRDGFGGDGGLELRSMTWLVAVQRLVVRVVVWVLADSRLDCLRPRGRWSRL